MEKKPKKNIGTAKERRKKLGEAVDMNMYYKCQGKIRPVYASSSSNNNPFKEKKIICSVCKNRAHNATSRDCWYCDKCLKYSDTKNKERRVLGLHQNPNKSDFNKFYELKLNLKRGYDGFSRMFKLWIQRLSKRG